MREVGYGLSLEGASAADLVPTVNLTPETEVCLKSVKSARRGKKTLSLEWIVSPVHRKLLSFSRPGCTDSLRFVF